MSDDLRERMERMSKAFDAHVELNAELAHDNAKLRERVAARDATIAELTAERDALRKDAERYRWLCAFPARVRATGLARVALVAFNASKPKPIVDAAIDAALSDTAALQRASLPSP